MNPQNNPPNSFPLAAFSFVALLLLFLLGGILFFFSTAKEWEEPFDAAGLLRGKASTAFEKFYDKQLIYRDAAISSWGALRYGLFRTGSKGAVVGTEGWLYTAEEFELTADYEHHLMRNLTVIGKVRAYLEQHHIELLTVIIPAKARLYPEYLSGKARPAAWENIYRQALKTLRSHVIDGGAVLRNAKTEQPVFMARDTHWSPAGAQSIAFAIADNANQRHLPMGESPAVFHTLKKEEASHEGDLLDFVRTGFFRNVLGPDNEPLERYATENTGATDLFGTPEIAIALIGTSYSAGENWNFEGFLKEALQRDVLNLADEGSGPMEPMAKFLRETDFEQSPLQLVIWEFPERYLPVDYSALSWPWEQPEAQK